MRTITSEQRRTFREQGYLILPNALSRDRLQSLIDAVNRFFDRAIAGQFSEPFEWVDEALRIPARVNNLLTPEAYDPVFGEWFDADMIPAIEAIFEAPTRCSWLTMLASGGGHQYSTIWHRDYCRIDSPAEAPVIERDLLRHCSFQAPLEPGDRFLQVVPGSHARAATEKEVTLYRKNKNSDLPGQMTIEVEPGDLVFRHGNILHRGFNPEGKLRRTLFAGFWREDAPVWREDCADREAMLTPGHLDRMPPRTRMGIERYLDAFPEGEPESAKEYSS